jgi:hypothetical protein
MRNTMPRPAGLDGESGMVAGGRFGDPVGHRSSNLGAWPVVASVVSPILGALRGEYGAP